VLRNTDIHREAKPERPPATKEEAMKKIVLAGLGALAMACGGGTDDSIRYGASEPSTYDEQVAIESAQGTLQATVAHQPSTEPAYGAPGLADQLTSDLGAYAAVAAAPTVPMRSLASRSLHRSSGTALTVGMDPACVGQTETSVTWTDCIITISNTDPDTGDTLDSTTTVNGSLTWNPATGVSSWDVVEVLDMTMTQGGETLTLDAVVHPAGTITVTDSTIVGHGGSSASATATYQGMTVREAFHTTLDLDLGYQVDPFCITSGTLQLEQIWDRRPAGATAADLPNRGWQFDWAGCGQFAVAHGT
jgi:hypothetical protein